MTINAYPFEGQPTTEAQYSRLFRELRGSGIAASADSNAYQAIVEDGTHVRVKPGFALIQGFAADLTADEVVAFTAAPFQSYRTDRLVLRLNPDTDSITLTVLKGDDGSTVAPALTQTTAGIYDLPVAIVKISYGANPTITDERIFCGQDSGAWTTAGRPASPRVGKSGFNMTLKRWEFWDGTTWADVYAKSSAEAMTTAQRDALTGASLFPGKMVENIDRGVVQHWTGTEWKTVKANRVGQVFTSSGALVVPAGVTKLDIFLVGGGASGGASYNGASMGGRGGACALLQGVPVTPGSTITVTVGAGGVADTTSKSSQITNMGGSSSVSGTMAGTTVTISAAGGNGNNQYSTDPAVTISASNATGSQSSSGAAPTKGIADAITIYTNGGVAAGGTWLTDLGFTPTAGSAGLAGNGANAGAGSTAGTAGFGGAGANSNFTNTVNTAGFPGWNGSGGSGGNAPTNGQYGGNGGNAAPNSGAGGGSGGSGYISGGITQNSGWGGNGGSGIVAFSWSW